MSIRLALLGVPQIYRGTDRIELNIAKVQALLGYLAVTRQPQSRDHLLALLWAESHPEAARKNLRNRLWQLRQAFAEEVLVSQGDRLALADTVTSDVAAFEQGLTTHLAQARTDRAQLQAVLDLWHGPLLADLYLHEAPDFEIWLSTERARFSQLYLRGLTALLAAQQQQGDWQGVLTWAQKGLAQNPLQEPLHQQVMTAYAHLGARHEALRQYEQLRALLAQELGVEPLAETEAIYQAIAQERGSSYQSAVSSQPLPVTSQQPTALTQTPAASAQSPFVGRQAQLAALDQALQQARQGRATVVLLSGEMGIGKTRLWQIWSAQVTGAVLLATRCLDTTQNLPFEPIQRLLSSAPCRTQLATMINQLLPAWQAELVHLAPQLQTLLTAPLADLPAAGEPRRTVEALTQFLRSLTAQPLILFMDDLHWADEATLDWLLYLTDRMANEPLLLVGAYRSTEVPASLTRLSAHWQRAGILHPLPLPSLTVREAEELLTALGYQGTLAEMLHTQSGGNPYYLTQLSDVAVDGIPATLRQLVEARLGYLAANLQPILQAAAVLEPAIDLNSLQATSGRSEEETLDAADGLVAAGVLVERDAGYEFTHPLVANVVRANLSNGRRKLLHRRAAAGLHARYADQLARVAGQLALHYSAAGQVDEAARFADLAGDEAVRVYALAEANHFYQRAYDLAPTPARLLNIGATRLLQPDQLADGRAIIQAALQDFEHQGDQAGAVKAGLRLAASYLGTEAGDQVLYWAKRVLPDLEVVTDAGLHANAHYLLGTAKFRNGYALTEASAHYAEATRLAAEQPDDRELLLGTTFEWGNLDIQQGEYDQAVAKFQQALALSQIRRDVFFTTLSYNNLAHATLLAGDPVTAQSHLTAGMELAVTYALHASELYLWSTQGEIALARGAWAEATAAFERALALAESHANPTFAANVQAHLGRVAQAQGDWAVAQRHLQAAQEAVAASTATYLQAQIDLWLADLYCQLGEPGPAVALAEQVIARSTRSGYWALYQKATQIRNSQLHFSSPHSASARLLKMVDSG